MVDIHSHILPNVDDGSRSWEMTAEMCRIAIADGIRHIVATPHCNHQYPYDRELYESMLTELRTAAKGELEFSIGCDFHFSYENITSLLEDPLQYTIARKQYLLVEFSDYALPPNLGEQLATIGAQGLVPIVTHPERNPLIANRPEFVLEMIGAGALVQVTANSLTGFWGPRAKSTGEWLLHNGAVHVLATDAHDPRSRKPVLSEARKIVAGMAGQAVAEALVFANPQAIVEGREISPF